jgi:hypothetical protein
VKFAGKLERSCENQNVLSTTEKFCSQIHLFSGGFKKVKYFGRLRVRANMMTPEHNKPSQTFQTDLGSPIRGEA